MVGIISNKMITTMTGGVVEGGVQEVEGGAMDLVEEEEVMMISKNHHQVLITT